MYEIIILYYLLLYNLNYNKNIAYEAINTQMFLLSNKKTDNFVYI